MKSKLKRIEQFSGDKATIYSVLQETAPGVASLMIDQFIDRYKEQYLSEVIDILRRLKSLGNVTGCIASFFKLNEGLVEGDLVCALYDVPDHHLRLYCILLSDQILIVGDGGPKRTRTWQEDPQLTKTVHDMMNVSDIVRTKMRNGDLSVSRTGLLLEGDLYISKI